MHRLALQLMLMMVALYPALTGAMSRFNDTYDFDGDGVVDSEDCAAEDPRS